MKVLFCGIDAHKDSVTACVRVDARNGDVEFRKKSSKRTTAGWSFCGCASILKGRASPAGVHWGVLEGGVESSGRVFPADLSQSISGEESARM